MKHYSLVIPKHIEEALIEHAQSLTPIESCGYLGGNNGEITTFYPMTNVDNSHDHFSFDPKEQFSVVKKARQANEQLLAVYHSHPETPARLSDEDLRLFNDPDPVYIIVSLSQQTPVINGFKVFKPTENDIEIYKVQIKKPSGGVQ